MLGAAALGELTGSGGALVAAVGAGLQLLGGAVLYLHGVAPVSERMREATRMLRGSAEGGGNLSQRLPRASGDSDETTVMAQWTNSFIDNLEQIIRVVVRSASHDSAICASSSATAISSSRPDRVKACRTSSADG